MEEHDVLSALQEAATEILDVEASRITMETDFAVDLDADSLDLVELIMALEERFGISIPEEDLEGVTTVKAAVGVVLARAASGV